MHWNETGKRESVAICAKSCIPFFAYLLSQRCKKT